MKKQLQFTMIALVLLTFTNTQAQLLGKTNVKPDSQRVSDILPYAKGLDDVEPETYPVLGFGVGLSSSSDFSELDGAMTAVEDKYRKEGYSIKPHAQIQVSNLLWYNMKIRFSSTVVLLLEAGTSTGDGDEWKGASVSFLYNFHLTDVPWLRPYMGMGVSHYRFKTERKYGDRISPVSTDGSYKTFDAISTDGEGNGLLMVGGIELPLSRNFDLDIYANYMVGPKVEVTSSTNVRAQVNLGGLLWGARFSFFF